MRMQKKVFMMNWSFPERTQLLSGRESECTASSNLRTWSYISFSGIPSLHKLWVCGTAHWDGACMTTEAEEPWTSNEQDPGKWYLFMLDADDCRPP